jgi:hypothetical protein
MPKTSQVPIIFLAGQNGLSLVFLNGCSTHQQTRELVAASVFISDGVR